MHATTCAPIQNIPEMDPLQLLPAEIVLRILEFSSVSGLSNLARVNSSWRQFIDGKHQDNVWVSHCRDSIPNGTRDLSSVSYPGCFVDYYNGVYSFKDLCKRQTLLDRNWSSEQPITRESVFQIGNDPVWRFRPDFQRRFFVSTSQEGGLYVTDMDSGGQIWSLSREEVKPFAHLEYHDGVVVVDSKDVSNALEVWKTDSNGDLRGTFQKTAVLTHDCEIRGFQLSYDTLCVVSSQGQGFVYDMTENPPRLRTHLKIKTGAVGHLHQNASIVLYCLGKDGYHIHDKTSGTLLGVIHPQTCKIFWHINHPYLPPNSIISTGDSLSSLPSIHVYPPRNPNRERLTPIQILQGNLTPSTDGATIKLEDDEWGAALLSGSLMVAISKGGRLFVCSDWQAAIRDRQSTASTSYLIECEGRPSTFHMGGWLSLRDSRVMFEVQDQVYIVTLGEDENIQPSSSETRPSYSLCSSSAIQLSTPVSFMALFEDCIMSTYTTVGWRRRTAAQQRHRVRAGIFPTKTIRVLSLAPNLDTSKTQTETFSPGPSEETHAMILEIMDVLSDDSELEDDEYD